MRRSLSVLGPVALALVVLQGLSAADPSAMLPLHVGNHWGYVTTSGTHQVETITGTRTLRGRTVFVKSYAEEPNVGLENYWLTGPEGEVLLAGFLRPGSGVAYDPPIVLCGGAPVVGDTWPTHVTSYDLADSTLSQTFDITYGALEDVSLLVPAGRFPCIGVGQVVPGISLAVAGFVGDGLTLDGRRVTGLQVAAGGVPSDWYSPGVGVVQYGYIEMYRLEEYGVTTPALATSWGAVKASYR